MSPIQGRFAVAALLLLPAVRARGGHIALNLTLTAEVSAGVLRVAVTITNAGDEAAGSVRPRLSLGTREVLGPLRESLSPRESFEAALWLPVPELGPGRWPFRLAVDYTDANHHPFQALQVASIVLGDPGPVGLELVGIETTPLAGTGAVRVRVRNAGALARQARIGLLAPRDLEVEEAGRSVAIAPGEQVEVSLPVAPRTALPGSRYAVFVVLEYDEAGVHQSLVADSVVLVRERRGHLLPGLLSASAALMLVWWIAVRRRRAARTPALP